MKTNRCRIIVVFASTILLFVFCQTATADPPEMPGNHGVPGLLAEVAELRAQIAELEAIIQGYENFAPVPRTGQSQCYDSSGSATGCENTGQDGELGKGVPWPTPRFTDNLDGTVTDNLTGLIWLKDADCFGEQTWFNALSVCETLASSACGLTDGSVAGDWRLPNVRELQSLIDFGFYEPALPNTAGTGKWSEGNPFTGVLSNSYWSSTTYEQTTYSAWHMYMYIGRASYGVKTDYIGYHVWPVRNAN